MKFCLLPVWVYLCRGNRCRTSLRPAVISSGWVYGTAGVLHTRGFVCPLRFLPCLPSARFWNPQECRHPINPRNPSKKSKSALVFLNSRSRRRSRGAIISGTAIHQAPPKKTIPRILHIALDSFLALGFTVTLRDLSIYLWYSNMFYWTVK